LTRLRKAQHLRVAAQALPRLQARAQPFNGFVQRGALQLHELNAAAGQLVLGLHPIAAVCEDGAGVGGHGQHAGGAGEARQPLPRLPALG
jgi:hypothetical protein